MKKLNPNIIRIDDKVQVINPDIFLRCGYPLDFHDEFTRVEYQYRKAIENFFVETCGYTDRVLQNDKLFDHAVTKCLRAITYVEVRKKKFGGKERSIYTERDENLSGFVGYVTEIRFVKTGTYVPGCRTHYEYDEYDPPYLANEQTHKILKLVREHITFWIEAKNVLKFPKNSS